jgi:hypothetical protein
MRTPVIAFYITALYIKIMKPPCEIIVQDILPALRALLAEQLMQQGLSQAEAAEKLGLTQAAVSQYQRKLRGSKARMLTMDRQIASEIRQLAAQIAANSDKISSLRQACAICRSLRQREQLCELHKEKVPALASCKICADTMQPSS